MHSDFLVFLKCLKFKHFYLPKKVLDSLARLKESFLAALLDFLKKKEIQENLLKRNDIT